MKNKTIKTQCIIATGLALLGLNAAPSVRADAVTDWNATAEDAA